MRKLIAISSILLVCMFAGCSDDDSDTGTNPGNPPGTPTGLAVTVEGLNSLTLAWDEVTGATNYKLYRANSETDSYLLVYSGAAAGFESGGILFVRTYWYRVTAENSHGESDPSAPVSGSTAVPSGFVVSGSPGGAVDYTYNYHSELNGHPRYQSDPIGINIIFPATGDHAGQWVFNNQVEGIDIYYSTSDSDYPPPSGYYTHVGDTRTSITLTAF